MQNVEKKVGPVASIPTPQAGPNQTKQNAQLREEEHGLLVHQNNAYVNTPKEQKSGFHPKNILGTGYRLVDAVFGTDEEKKRKFDAAAATLFMKNDQDFSGVPAEKIITALVACAQTGLLPDGKEATVVVRKRNAIFQPMVYGISKIINSLPGVCGITAHVVTDKEIEKQRFIYTAGDHEEINHEPIIFGDRGKVVGAYATVHYLNGFKKHEFMRLEEIEKCRKSAQTDVAWGNHFDEMAKKSVIHRLYKRIGEGNIALSLAMQHYENEFHFKQPEKAVTPIQRKNQLDFLAEHD